MRLLETQAEVVYAPPVNLLFDTMAFLLFDHSSATIYLLNSLTTHPSSSACWSFQVPFPSASSQSQIAPSVLYWPFTFLRHDLLHYLIYYPIL